MEKPFFITMSKSNPNNSSILENMASKLLSDKKAKGIEFIAYGNVMMNKPRKFGNGLTLTPRYTFENGGKDNLNKINRTCEMQRHGKLEYDGFLPLDVTNIQEVKRGIQIVNETLASLSLV